MDPRLRTISACRTSEEEFWYHVSQQDELPLAAAKPRPEIAVTLEGFLVQCNRDDRNLGALVAQELLDCPALLNELRALIALSDKRLYLDLSYIFSRTVYQRGSLCGCAPSELTRHQTSFFLNLLRSSDGGRARAAAELISSYLMKKGLDSIVTAYSSLTLGQRTAIVESLIAPKEVQQQEAKLRGHGPEATLARLLSELRVPIRPVDKAENPMAERDPNVSKRTLEIVERNRDETFSSDIVIVDPSGLPIVCIVSLIHSSDPGQFGVDKANTVAAVKRTIKAFNRRQRRQVELWGLVDGVGYSENKNGTINAMLPHFDCFLQLKSLWKAVLRLHAIGLCRVSGISFDEQFYTPALIQQLNRYVPTGVRIMSASAPVPENCAEFNAGRARVFVAA